MRLFELGQNRIEHAFAVGLHLFIVDLDAVVEVHSQLFVGHVV